MAREIGRVLDGYKVIVTKSTVPVGTSARVRGWIAEEQARLGEARRFSVASNPEFLREGAAIGDFMRPDRVVIGTEDDQAVAILKDLYRPLYLNETPVVLTDVPTAEPRSIAGGRAKALAAVRRSERRLQRVVRDACVAAASGDLARALASVAASTAQHGAALAGTPTGTGVTT